MKKKLAYLAAGILIFTQLLSLVLPFASQKVFAAGETYTWQDYQHIAVSGGDTLTGPATLSLSSNATLPGEAEQFVGSFPVKDNGQACSIGIFLALTSPNTGGTITSAAEQTEASSSGTTCTGGLGKSYVNTTVAIGGNRGSPNSQTETQPEKKVLISVNPQTTSSLPDSVKVTVTNTATNKSSSYTLPKSTDPNGNVSYGTTAYFDQGNYKVCASPALGTTCQTFPKVIYQSTLWLLGEPLGDQNINVTVVLNYDTKVTTSNQVGPIPVTMYSSGGNVLGTTQTDSQSINDQTNCNNFGTATGSTCTSGTSNTEATLRAVLQNAPSGEPLQICLGSDKNLCKTVTREVGNPASVTFNLDKATSALFVTNTLSNGAADAPSCESSGASLSWIMCPIINDLVNAVDGIYSKFIQPLLVTKPLSFDAAHDPTKTFQIWSSFRIYGDIFLVIALLVVVFGESIGGGLIDAYAAKKILPRLLIAAIAINLSIYIIALAVDVTNILGNGINGLLTAPFSGVHGGLDLRLNGTTSTLGLAALLGAGFWAAISGGPLFVFLLTFTLLPAFLTFIGILVVVLLRRALIIVLVFLAPVAFALYCLPNTEKYFKQWWELLVKTLLIYPIIATLFAVAHILSVTINSTARTSGVVDTVGNLLSIVALIVPLFLIPFSFKLAGGILGRLHETLSGFGKRAHEAYKGNVNDMNSRQNRARRGLADRNVLNRERGVSGIGGLQKSDSGFRRRLGRGLNPLGRALNYGDLEAKRSALTKQEAELRELKTNYGPDSSVRAIFAQRGDDGIWRSTINGAAFSDLEVQKAHQLYGQNAGLSATQAAFNYELGKTANDDEYARFLQQAPAIMEGMGYSSEEIGGVMKGIGFNNQTKRLDLKHSSFEKQSDGTWKRSINYAAMAQDAAENFGSYPLSNMKTSPITALEEGYDNAEKATAEAERMRTAGASSEDIQKVYDSYGFKESTEPDGTKLSGEQLATRTMADVGKTAKILDTRWRTEGRSQVVQQADQVGEVDGQPVGAGTGAPGRVDEAINSLVNRVRPRPEQNQT